MAKRRIAIFLSVDDKPSDENSGTRQILEKEGQFPGADETYKVYVNRDEDDKKNFPGVATNRAMLTTAAHEMGHVLSSVFKIPGGMQEDPRGLGEIQGCCPAHAATPEQKERINRNETLAWDIAREIAPNLNEDMAKRALDSYLVKPIDRIVEDEKGPTREDIESVLAHIDSILAKYGDEPEAQRIRERAQKAMDTLQPA